MALCYVKLHLVALRHGPCLMGPHRVITATHTFYNRKGRATPGNIHPQSSITVTRCLLIATDCTDPRKNDSLCQARECHRELNPGRWFHRRVCYHVTVTCASVQMESVPTRVGVQGNQVGLYK